MKKTLTMLLALLMAACLFAVPASAAEITLQLSEVHADGYPTSLADLEFARLVKERTNGRIEIEVFTGGTLYGAEPDAIIALQNGSLGFTRVSASPVGNFVPAINAIQMPYLYKNKAHMWAVLNGEIGQGILSEIEKAPNSGLVGLAYYDAGSRSFYLTKEVHTVADLAGLKIRMQDNKMMLRMVELLGAIGVSGIGPNEVYSNIVTKVIDGAENNWPTYQNMGDYEAAKYYILDQHTRVPEILLASQAVMDSLSAEDQALIREIAVEVQAYEIEQWELKEKSSEEIVRAAGTTVIELTDEARAEFEEKMLPLYDEFGADYKDIIDQIKALGADF
ncbi:MAG: TRAP transporter substrate-binding protein [Oscillospiraceae bacterium]|jgi:tripartite ATP-independent transporter DctP family solute receptor|nr:TRAP transporter substrate-binding protein [Oscillospiraceae bacterium]